MAPVIPFIIDPNASAAIIEVAKATFDFDGSKTLCKCQMCILFKSMEQCSNCKLSFADALEYQQVYITNKVKMEIDAIAKAKANEAIIEATFPAGISRAIKTMCDDHLVPAYEDEGAYWKNKITDNGYGDHPYSTVATLDIHYKTLATGDRKAFLDNVRLEADYQGKIDAYKIMLDAGKAP